MTVSKNFAWQSKGVKCKSNVYKNLRLLLLFIIIISNYKVSRYIIH